VDAFEAEREAMSQQPLSHTQRAKALDTANEKINELQSQVETFEAECVAMSEQLELNIAREKELQSQIEAGADTQRSLEEATGRAEQADRELSDTRGQISTLEQDIESARAAMVDIEAAKSHLESELTGQIDSLKAQLAQSESRASESQAELKRLEDHLERVDDGTTATEDRSHGEAKSSDGNEQTAVAHVTNLIDTLRQHVASAEKGLESERSRSAELAVQVETLNTRLDEVDASATEERSAKDTEINTLQASLDEMTKNVQAKSFATANLERTCDDLRATIITLEQQLAEGSSSSAEEVQALQSIQHDLRGQLDAALDKVEALRIQVSSVMSKNQQLTLDLSKTITEAQAHQESLAASDEIVKTLQGDVDRLEKENQQTTGLMKYHESESQQRSVITAFSDSFWPTDWVVPTSLLLLRRSYMH
jgi:chromosome segregation ATPase